MMPYTHCPFCITELILERSSNFFIDKKCVGCANPFKQWINITNQNDILLMFSTSQFRLHFHIKEKILDAYRLSHKLEKIFRLPLPPSFLDNITNHDYLNDKINKLIAFL